MFGSLIRRPGFWLAVFLVVVAVLVLAACDKKQPDIPSPHPLPCATWQAPDGTWMEEDNEEVDSDPCDLDDAFKVRTTAPAKPKPSPTKKNNSTKKP